MKLLRTRLAALEAARAAGRLRREPRAPHPVLAAMTDDALERLQEAQRVAEDPRATRDDRNRAAATADALWAAAVARLNADNHERN